MLLLNINVYLCSILKYVLFISFMSVFISVYICMFLCVCASVKRTI